MIRGRAATPDPFDLGALTSSDALFDALSARRIPDPAQTEDPAAALLTALVADVDAGAPPLHAPLRAACGGTSPSVRRRGTRVFVTFGVVALVLTSGGAAAAGGGGDPGLMGAAAHGRAESGGAERSNDNARRHDAALTVRPNPRRAARSGLAPDPGAVADAARVPEGRRGHRPSRAGWTRARPEVRHVPARTDPYPSPETPTGRAIEKPTGTPTPRPEDPSPAR